MRSHAPKATSVHARTRQALWNIKQEKPELFERRDVEPADNVPEGPPGFEPFPEKPGWLHHPGRGIFLEKETGRQCWFDVHSQEYLDLRDGRTLVVTFTGGAAARLGSSAASAATLAKAPPPGSATLKTQVPRHVFISDLHRVAEIMKTELAHFDKPSAMLAVFETGNNAGGVAVDVAARVFHERLIKRLAAFRSDWPNEALCAAAAGALEDLGAPATLTPGAAIPPPPAVAVALVLGHRLVTAATSGASYWLLGRPSAAGEAKAEASEGNGPARRSLSAAPGPGEPIATGCWPLEPGLGASPLMVALLAGKTGELQEEEIHEAVTSRLAVGRPRAASVALLKKAAAKGASGALVAGAAWLGPGSAPGGSASSSAGQEPPAKRQKSETQPSKVRVKQILLRSWKGAGPPPTDPIRRKQVNRTPEAAEAQLLEVLDGLVADNCAGFSAQCKAISECQSALKGGELAGDLGWLDRATDDQQAKGPSNPAAAIKPVVPANVRKAAFELEIGELSDILASEQGAHVLLRTA